MKRDTKLSNPRYKSFPLTEAPDYNFRGVTVPVKSFKQKTELALQTTVAQLANEIEQATVR
jgi:hypothetical protein